MLALLLLVIFIYKIQNNKLNEAENNHFDTDIVIASINEDQIEKINLFHYSLKLSEKKKRFAQHSEDSILLRLVEYINKKWNGTFVEFGTGNGDETNTRYLREHFGWKGLLMDGYSGHPDNPKINLHNEKISHENILSLFEKYKVPIDLDILSEDTDYADYWIVEKILSKYRPKIVVHEINQQTPDRCVSVLRPTAITYWDGRSEYSGASVCAFQCLAKRFNYTMIYCESSGVNCFWLRDDILFSLFQIETSVFKQMFTPAFLWSKPNFTTEHSEKVWQEIKC